MSINIEYYRIFCEVARCGNITKAAKALGSNQPNVSRVIKNLEQQMHCSLFVRAHNGVSLTTERQHLLDIVEPAIMRLERADAEAEKRASLDSGSVSLSASETALRMFLLERLAAFHREHPHVTLRIFNGTTPQALEALQNYTADFAVVTTPARLAQTHQTFNLGEFHEILVGGSSFSDVAAQGLTLGKLAEYPLVGLSRGTMSYEFYQDIFFRQGLPYRPDIEVGTFDQILPFVENDLGLAFVPEELTRDALDRGRIVQIPLQEEIPARSVLLVCDAKRPLRQTARALKDVICSSQA